MTLSTLLNGFRFLLLTAVAVLVGACSNLPQDSRIAITNVTAIDARNGVRDNVTVIIENDQIIDVTSEPSTLANAKRIDGTGKFLIPGLWDMHVHLVYDKRLTESMSYEFLRHGITSVRDTGGLLSELNPVIDQWRQPNAVAPRVYISGPLMDGEYVVYDGQVGTELGKQNTSVEQALRNLEELHNAGVDFIKIYEMVSPEVFKALSVRARELNLPIASHVPLAMRASEVAPLVDSMEHLRNLELDCVANPDELLEVRKQALQNEENLSGGKLRSSLHILQRNAAIKAMDRTRCEALVRLLKNVIQVPTARLNLMFFSPPWKRADWSQAVSALPQDVRDEWQSPPSWYTPAVVQRNAILLDHNLSMVARLAKAGVPIGAGTDTPIGRAIPGYSLHSELEFLVRAGLTPMQALESATLIPASFFSKQNVMGTIAPGMSGDVVLLNTNPLDNISHTRDIAAVIFRGQLLEEPN